MDISAQEIYTLILVFFARLVDVSIGTIRIVMVSRGYRNIAPILGFFEIFIWMLAISNVLTVLKGFHSYAIYAAGFAVGNYVGMWLESHLHFGYQSVRIITSEIITALPLTLREMGYGVTSIRGNGLKGEVNILYTVVHRRDVSTVLETVATLEPMAFITVEDLKAHKQGFIAHKNPMLFYNRGGSKKH